jgi:hypothetical protein
MVVLEWKGYSLWSGHYWERKDYDAMANARSPQTSNHSTNQLTNAKQSSSGSNKDKNCNKGNNSNSKCSANNSTPQRNAPDLSSKLGKDGKLMPEEHQCCFNQGLCMLCGTKVLTGFTKGSASAPKPRAGSEGLASTS